LGVGGRLLLGRLIVMRKQSLFFRVGEMIIAVVDDIDHSSLGGNSMLASGS
jgi:hypothetical protein